MPDGRPLTLAGKSDARWRERIGNAVPQPAAKAMGEVILMALLPSLEGEWVLGSTDIWVRPRLIQTPSVLLERDRRELGSELKGGKLVSSHL